MRLLLPLALLAAAAPASAQSNAAAPDPVTLTSKILVLHDVAQPDGTVAQVAETPERVLPGDPILIRIDYATTGAEAVKNFTAVNAIPAGLEFTSTSSAADYSVDGGESWGPLGTLTVTDEDGTRRPAVAADVTHLRFKAPDTLQPGATGQFAFNSVVR